MGARAKTLSFALALAASGSVPRPALAAEQKSAAEPKPATEPKPTVVAPAPLGALDVAYPEGAHGDAEVALELVIAEDGTVSSATVLAGEPPFAEAARVGAEEFRFTPATRNGIPVRARIAVKIYFREPVPQPVAPPPPPSAAPGSETTAPAPPAPTTPPETEAAEPPMEVVVLGEQRVELGSIHIPREEARRVPGAFGDPFRVVEALPGVAPVLSALPYYYIRGAPPGDVGYFIDGIRVPLLFHVGPGPSIVAPILIDRVDLFPGTYPVRFGRYAGAVLAGETLAPSDHSRAEGQARIFDASALIEHPFAGGRGSVALGGRYSFTQAILAAVAPKYELGYGDYQARLAYAVTPNDRLSVFAFGGFDLLRNTDDDQTLFDVAFHRVDLRWDQLTQKRRIRVGLTLSSDNVLTAPDDPGVRGTTQDTRGIRARVEFEQDLFEGVRLRAGGDGSADHVAGDRELVGNEIRTFPTRTDLASSAWTDVIWQPAPGVEIVPGARVDVQRSREKNYAFFEPRLSTRTRLAQGVAYLAGFGLAHQLPAASTRMPGRRPTGVEVREQEAVQASQGVEYALPEGMLGRTTVFHQYITVDEPGVHGRSFGLEQFLRRNFTNRLGGFLSYTLSRAEGAIDAREFVVDFDRTHIVSAVLGYDFGAGYRLGLRGYYASGRETTVDCPTPDCGPGDPTAPRVFEQSLRLPGFFRLDFRFEKRWRFKSGFWITATAEWFNATLSSEVQDVDWTPQGLVEDEPSPLTLPSVGVELGW